MFLRDGAEPVVREVEHDLVRPPTEPRRLLPAAGAGGGEEVGEGRSEAVECGLEELDLLRRHVGRRLGALRQPVHRRQRQGNGPDQAGQALWHRREPGDVPRRGDEGDGVAPRRQPPGELEERDEVAERQPLPWLLAAALRPLLWLCCGNVVGSWGLNTDTDARNTRNSRVIIEFVPTRDTSTNLDRDRIEQLFVFCE